MNKEKFVLRKSRKIETKRPNGSKRIQKDVGNFTNVKQSHKEECDVKNIIKKYRAAGAPLPVADNPELYGNYAIVGDFVDAQQTILKAQEQFNGLDAYTRERFDNDPAKMLAFVNNPANRDELIELGFIPKPEQKDMSTQKVDQTTETTTTPLNADTNTAVTSE